MRGGRKFVAALDASGKKKTARVLAIVLILMMVMPLVLSVILMFF